MPIAHVNEIRMYYEMHSPEGRPVIALLRGLGSSVRDWEMPTPFFETDYRVLPMDMGGRGRADKPKRPYSVDGW